MFEFESNYINYFNFFVGKLGKCDPYIIEQKCPLKPSAKRICRDNRRKGIFSCKYECVGSKEMITFPDGKEYCVGQTK